MAFTVDVSGVIRGRIHLLLREALATGQAQAFRASFVTLIRDLQADPFLPGEIKYHLGSHIPVHGAARAPVAMSFAIHEPSQVVWVLKIDRMIAPGESLPSEP
jgi:hypothetical protein